MSEAGYLAFVAISDGWKHPGVTPDMGAELRKILAPHSDAKLEMVASILKADPTVTRFDFKQIRALLRDQAVKTLNRTFWWTMEGDFGGDPGTVEDAERSRIVGYLVEHIQRHPKMPVPTDLLKALGAPPKLIEMITPGKGPLLGGL